MKSKGSYTLIILLCAGLSVRNSGALSQEPLLILPLGNSITYDDNSLDKDNPRPVGDRIAYRYTLYQLLNDAGYLFDYVGSENSGNNYFNDPELDDNAGFPGIETSQLTELISTGFNAITGEWETPGPYLIYYPSDIILLHIGTNNLTESAADVESLLDTIRFFEPDVIVLIARIINRQTYHPSTTLFNNNVESMVNSRGDDRIIMVDMEAGAGIDYATEMADNLHPKPAGFDKMAQKWFEAIDLLNQPPVITTIPDQLSSLGAGFTDVSLDEYVDDMEDPDDQLTWSFILEEGSHLDVSLDGNRFLHVIPQAGWRGSEGIMLRVEDTGSGTFRKSDSTVVRFTVNDPPVITSTPALSETYVDESFQYTLTASDADELDTLTFYVISKPDWLSFSADADSAELSGVPSGADAGSDSITLMVSDGFHEVYQVFTLDVRFPEGTPQNSVLFDRIYPNPATNELVIRSIHANLLSISISSLNGKLVYSSTIEGPVADIDLTTFPKGIYFVTIRSEDTVSIQKIEKL